MEAKAKSFKFLGETKKLTVPFFQRNYVWGKDNWKEFLESLTGDSMPFIGSFILKRLPTSSECLIIDGQQRLTTLTILTKAIFDCIDDSKKEIGSGIRKGVEAFLFYVNNTVDDFDKSNVKIEHSRVDKEDYEKIIWANLLGHPAVDVDNITDESSQVLKCYKYYYNEFKKWDDDKLKELFGSIFDDNRKVVVVIELDYKDINEQQIFDTINRSGVKLSIADIIKNNLFKQCLELCESSNRTRDDVCDLYDENWDKVFYDTPEKVKAWDEERSFGNIKRTNLEFLLYCIAVIKWGKSKETFNDLEGCYIEGLKNSTYGELVDFIVDIKKYANIYKEYIIDFHNSFLSEEDKRFFSHTKYVKKLLLTLDMFGVQMFYPYVLKRLYESKCDMKNQQLIRDFNILASFVVRRRLSKKGVSDYAIKCDQIIHGDGIEKVLISDMVSYQNGISNQDIKTYIQGTINNDTARTILFCVELYRRFKSQTDVDSMAYSYSLEHIMPKSWEKNWNDVEVLDENGKIVDDIEEKARIRENHISNIGNMTLLTTKLNSKVSNRCFSDKINGIIDAKGKEVFGYRKSSTMLLTKEIINRFDNNDVVWDEKHIEKRAIEILKDILEIWPDYKEMLPQEDNSDNNQNLNLESDNDLDINGFSKNAFANAIDMLNEIDAISVVGSELVENDYVDDNYTDIDKSFDNYINSMKMSSSYKPIFLKAILDSSDEHGVSKISEIVKYFFDYYLNRRNQGLITDKDGIIIAEESCTYADAEKTILQYPYDVFSKNNFVDFDASKQTFSINAKLWEKIKSEKQNIINICDNNLKQYYSKL